MQNPSPHSSQPPTSRNSKYYFTLRIFSLVPEQSTTSYGLKYVVTEIVTGIISLTFVLVLLFITAWSNTLRLWCYFCNLLLPTQSIRSRSSILFNFLTSTDQFDSLMCVSEALKRAGWRQTIKYSRILTCFECINIQQNAIAHIFKHFEQNCLSKSF